MTITGTRLTPTTRASRKKACRLRVTAGSDVARFDVHPHPDAALRKKTPYLLDVQNNHISRIARVWWFSCARQAVSANRCGT